MKIRGERIAFGAPGIGPRWTHGNKDGIGTAYSASSRIWFTIFRGIVTEVYYPTIDRPQIRDLQFLVTDGQSFFHEEKRHMEVRVEKLSNHDLGYRVISSDPDGRYRIVKEIITEPHAPCVLIDTMITGDETILPSLRFYVLCAPHLEIGGWKNNGYVGESVGRQMLMAEKNGIWAAIAATVPFSRLSCGYVGQSDGWTDLHENYEMDWEFDRAPDGNIALTAELELNRERRFTLALAFGDGSHNAETRLAQALAIPFENHRKRYFEQWDRSRHAMLPLHERSGDGGRLYHTSHSLLLAHEDKSYPGAIIASLSIPWGESKGDDDTGGYHLVWVRDMANSATALLATGDTDTPLRSLIYLATSQEPDGGFPQNFWLDGTPYWRGIQLDEVAFPILLARRLHNANALQEFDPYPMVLRAAAYLIHHGPVTEQERWEESSGYSPSTLASNIAALVCAAAFADERGDDETARYLEEYADFLECHIEAWTVTTEGTLLPEVPRHYIRINPASIDNPDPHDSPNDGTLTLKNQPPGTQTDYPAREIVDVGFLELVRYGIRKPDDPIIIDSLRVVDALLKVETPYGPCWHRYNHDGYGQQENGDPYEGYGVGRGWPLLSGERGHYELAAGGDPLPFLSALEQFATQTGLLPEQVWDQENRPEIYMLCGRPTGSAMPLMWAHAEYIKLLRSVADGRVFDLIPEVAERYGRRETHSPRDIWKPNWQIRRIVRGVPIRIQAPQRFRLHWSVDDWKNWTDTESTPTALGIEFVDIPIPQKQVSVVRFTFYWIEEDRWEGKDYEISMEDS